MINKQEVLKAFDMYTDKLERSLTNPVVILPTTTPTVNGGLALGDNGGVPALKLLYGDYIYYFSADAGE